MSYIHADELKNRFGEQDILDLADPNGVRDDMGIADAISMAIQSACSEIDSYLETEYDLPLVSAPRFLKNLAMDIAYYHLAGTHLTEAIEGRYKNAKKSLLDIRNGVMKLPIKKLPEEPVGVDITNPDRIMSRDKLGAY